ncbi:MAG TPA: FAD:protein FMN transferase [Rhodoblastus sp.]|nr:FAD:protein FMN transferase [Rhodoblastus sp.]
MARPTRRRVLRILAAAAATSLAPPARAESFEWRGAALGADVSVVFSSADAAAAEAAVARIVAEVERLESIFSLQRGDSELARLNAAGRLDAPSPDLVHVLARSREAYATTRGKFDPTVQPLWTFHVDWYAADRRRARPTEEDLADVRSRVGFSRVRIAPEAIELPARGALTLNGVAQGHITDRATDLLRAAGFRNVLVDLGETRVIETRVDGSAWRLELPDGRRIALSGGALATSSGAATQFADNGDHHIFDPATGRPAPHWRWLSVAHPSATVADGLSTGLYCLPPAEAARAARDMAGVRIWGATAAGETVET